MSAASEGSDSICETFPVAMAPAKVLTFAELGENPAVKVVPWRVLQDGTNLKAPRFQNLPLLIDLTPGEDVWLRAQAGIDYVALLKKHHNAAETVACKVLLELPVCLADHVRKLDAAIMRKAMEVVDVSSTKGYNWMPMMRTETAMMVNIVLDGSDAPTKLCFISEDGSVQQGEGLEFFKAQLGQSKMEEFSCKVWADMQFIDVQNDVHRKSIAVKVHSIALAKTPKEEVTSFSQDHVDSFVRAAKRIRVNRL